MYIEYYSQVNVYDVIAQGVDERMMNVHYFIITSFGQSYNKTQNNSQFCDNNDNTHEHQFQSDPSIAAAGKCK